MRIEIKPKYLRGLACHEGALVVIASSLDREYQLAFSDTFCFAYLQQTSSTVGEKIATSNEDFYGNIKKYCGIETYSVSVGSDVHKTVKKMIKKHGVVGVETDAYYCPWSFEFKKNRHGHHYLIVDYNNQGYCCIDTTMYEKNYDMDYENFSLGLKGITGFKVNDFDDEFNYKEIFNKSILSIINSTCVEDLQSFYNDFQNINYEKEFESFQNGHWGCAIQRNIGFYLIGSMELYSEFICHISSKLPNKNFNPLINSINEIKEKWNALYSIILKLYYSNFDFRYKERANSCLEEIIKKYNEAILLFKNYI